MQNYRTNFGTRKDLGEDPNYRTVNLTKQNQLKNNKKTTELTMLEQIKEGIVISIMIASLPFVLVVSHSLFLTQDNLTKSGEKLGELLSEDFILASGLIGLTAMIVDHRIKRIEIKNYILKKREKNC